MELQKWSRRLILKVNKLISVMNFQHHITRRDLHRMSMTSEGQLNPRMLPDLPQRDKDVLVRDGRQEEIIAYRSPRTLLPQNKQGCFSIHSKKMICSKIFSGDKLESI